MIPYVATTGDIRVTVRSGYLDDRSDRFSRQFLFGYFIRIENHGAQEVQLLRRHWVIREETGRVQEVEGDGVVGKQPVIPPGGAFEYSSFAEILSFEGSMEGTYLVERSDGARLQVAIPKFILRAAAN